MLRTEIRAYLETHGIMDGPEQRIDGTTDRMYAGEVRNFTSLCGKKVEITRSNMLPLIYFVEVESVQ